MPTVEIPLTAVSIQAARPTQSVGAAAVCPVTASPAARVLMRAALTGIPAHAVVMSAQVRLTQHAAASGSVTLTATANLGGWSTRTSWNARPTLVAPGQGSQVRSNPAALSQWLIPVTEMVQAWVSGTAPAHGLTISSTVNAGSLRGHTAGSGRPALVVEYAVAPVVPTGLHPSGGAIVSVAKPTLGFTTPSDTTTIQVQVDPSGNGTAPGFDSGEVASSAGLLNLASTSYAGLTSGASTQWRARAKNSFGWSAWSGWASLTYQPFGTLTIQSPATVTEDPSPPVGAVYVGTVTAWRVLLRNAAGRTVQDSGWRAGSVVEFPTTASVGAAGSVVVQVRDDAVGRVATASQPDYVQASRSFTVQPSGTPSPVTGFTVAQVADRPWVMATGTRSQLPDEVALYRDGVMVARVAGVAAFNGSSMLLLDYTAPLNAQSRYTVRAIVNGAFSDAAPVQVVTPRLAGIWIVDPATGAYAAIWGDEAGEQSEPEAAIVHTPLADGARAVRRRLARSPRQGALSGTIVDVGTALVADVEAALRSWIEEDAGRVYRLWLGNRCDSVILGNVEIDEVPLNGSERIAAVSLDWWLA